MSAPNTQTAALLAALQAIVNECGGNAATPYSIHSYLPPHLLAAAQQAIKQATKGVSK